MAYSVHDQGIVITSLPVHNNRGNLEATALEVFGTRSPQVNDRHVIEIPGDSPAVRSGCPVGLLDTIVSAYEGVYCKEDGVWKKFGETSRPVPEEVVSQIVPLLTDQLGNERKENYISMGAWQFPHDIPDAVLPVQEGDVRIVASGGQLAVETPVAVRLEVYSIQGRLMLQKNLSEGRTTVSLPGGMYVVKAGDAIKKVILKD
jgi:hypothetical protein